MEKVISSEKPVWKSVALAAALVSLGALMIGVAYGPETVAPILHDAFHDFRHAIGMPCH